MKSLRSWLTRKQQNLVETEYDFSQKIIFCQNHNKIIGIFPKFARRYCHAGFVICYDYDVFIAKDGCCRRFRMLEEEIIKLNKFGDKSSQQPEYMVAQIIVGLLKYDDISPELFWNYYHEYFDNIAYIETYAKNSL